MSKTIQNSLAIVIAVFVMLAITFWLGYQMKIDSAYGSVSVTDEYLSTSTAANAVYGAQTLGVLVKTGVGTFGSVVVTGANTGALNFYDATTTNALLRATATSTILVASIPASMAAGTYTFDVAFKHGLLMVLATGVMPTTTITYR